jgi:hypothetical protein
VSKLVDNSVSVSDKVAIHSSKNLFKYGVGKLKVGYNIVTQEAEEFWLTHRAVRKATPEEVAKAYRSN